MKKKNGKWRLIVDLRPLNAVVVRDVFPLPPITEVLRSMATCGCFSVLDITWAFWCIPVRAADTKYFAFRVGDELYEWLYAPM